MREIDINKKQFDSDFIKSLPSQPGKEFEIKKRLDRLKGTSRFNNNNNNNNNSSSSNAPDLFGGLGQLPTLPTIEDFLDGGPSLLPPPPPTAPINLGSNLFELNNANIPSSSDSNFLENVPIQKAPPTIWKKGIGNNLFGPQAATAIRENIIKTKTQQEVDDFLYELPDTGMPELVLGDDLIQTLGTEAEDLFDDNAPPTKNEEEDKVLKGLMDQYNVEDIKDTMDKTGQVPESIYFFYDGKNENFVNALEFIGLSPINRVFAAFWLSDLGRQTMTQNKISIHVKSGDIFYNNHNTGENFYSFLLSQQNDEAAYVPKNNFISK